ncbi:MAG: hypothetical protein AAF787_04245 [Chloroflexota bacterium]
MDAAQTISKTDQFDVLMCELHFTEDDLDVNRNGHLSERQQAYIRLDSKKNMLLGIAIVAVLVISTAILLFVGIQNNNLILQGLGVVLLFCNTGASLIFGMNRVRAMWDLRTNAVTVLEGEAQHVVRQFGRAQAGSVRIGEVVEVATSPEAFKAFVPGQTYRLYRSSHTKRILSVEPLA